jgi:hypothetical protein
MQAFVMPDIAAYAAGMAGHTIDCRHGWPRRLPRRSAIYGWVTACTATHRWCCRKDRTIPATYCSRAAAGLPGVQLVDKPASVSALFGTLSPLCERVAAGRDRADRAGVRLALRLRNVPRVLLPPVFGIGLTLAALGYLGIIRSRCSTGWR